MSIPESVETVFNISCAIFCVSACVLLAVFGTRAANKRDRVLKIQAQQLPSFPGWAQGRGLAYTPRDDSWLGISNQGPFAVGAEVWAEFVFHGRRQDIEVLYFQRSFQLLAGTDQPKGAESHRGKQAMVALRLPKSRPLLAVSPHSRFTKNATKFGMRDLILEHHAFNRRFHVYTDNDRFGYDVVDPQMMEWLAAEPRFVRRSLVIHGTWMYTWLPEPLTLDKLEPAADLLIDFYRRVPAHVWGYGD